MGPGDRVAAILPNLPEACIGMLAAAARGAIWSSCSPDFGPAALLERFGQITPKVLICADGYTYGGKHFDSLGVLAQLIGQLPSIERVALVSYLQPRAPLTGLENARALLRNWATPAHRCSSCRSASTTRLYILYSSGTTGAPKCIVHGVGGTLLQHQKEQSAAHRSQTQRPAVLLHDLQLDDVGTGW